MAIIQRKPGVALYYQIIEHMKEQIEKGIWEPGLQIPVETDLAALYGVSRMTVRQAISRLVKNGYLVSRQGSGTFVTMRKFEINALKLVYPEIFGRYHKLLSITEEETFPQVANALNLGEGEKVKKLYRLRYFQKVPAAIETAYFPVDLIPELDESELQNTLYEICEKNNISLLRASVTVRPVSISDRECEYLEIPKGSLGLLLTRVVYSDNDQPTLFLKNVLGGDKCQLVFSS